MTKSRDTETKVADHGQGLDKSNILQVYEKNRTSLKFFLSKFMITPQDIDDVSQETFLRAYKEEKKRQIDHPKAFLFRIARNLVLSDLNKKMRKITDYIEDYDKELAHGDQTLDDHVISRQQLGIYCEAVGELPPQCRKVVLMKKIYGMSCKEISSHLGISVSTVEKHLIKGIRRTSAIINARDHSGSESHIRTASSEVSFISKRNSKTHD